MTEIFTASLRHLAFVLCDRAACSGESGDRVYDACLVFVLHVHDLDHTQEERRIREKSLRSTENWICKGDLAVVSVKLPEREGKCLPSRIPCSSCSFGLIISHFAIQAAFYSLSLFWCYLRIYNMFYPVRKSTQRWDIQFSVIYMLK
jgi:hypothetical protein